MSEVRDLSIGGSSRSTTERNTEDTSVDELITNNANTAQELEELKRSIRCTCLICLRVVRGMDYINIFIFMGGTL